MNVDLERYSKFVEAVTSRESNSSDAMIARLETLAARRDLNPALLLTAAIGLSSESGEFSEIVKKLVFQGKEFDEDVCFHLKRELGDVIWYWINACRALNLDPNEVISENIKKLGSRYPGGKFDVFYSENRKSGDL